MAAETTKKPCPNQNEENSSHHLSQTTKKSNKKETRQATSRVRSIPEKNTRKITKMKKTAAMKQIASKPTKHPTNQPQHELYTRLHVESKTIQKGKPKRMHKRPPKTTRTNIPKEYQKRERSRTKQAQKQATSKKPPWSPSPQTRTAHISPHREKYQYQVPSGTDDAMQPLGSNLLRPSPR